MDVAALADRAEVSPFEPPVADRPGWRPAEAGDRWAADDPETGCRGVGDSPESAFRNLRYAVVAFEDDATSDVPYLSTGPEDTYEMSWRRGSAAGGWLSSVLDRFR